MHIGEDTAAVPGSLANSRNLDENLHGRNHFIVDWDELPGTNMGSKQSSPKNRATENRAKIDTGVRRLGFSPPQLPSASPEIRYTTEKMQS